MQKIDMKLWPATKHKKKYHEIQKNWSCFHNWNLWHHIPFLASMNYFITLILSGIESFGIQILVEYNTVYYLSYLVYNVFSH